MLDTVLFILLLAAFSYASSVLISAGISPMFVFIFVISLSLVLWISEPEKVEKEDAVPVTIIDGEKANHVLIQGGEK